jgi:hypothetical protein
MMSTGTKVGKSRNTAAAGLLGAVLAVLPAACGGSSGGADLGPAGKFLGRWSLDSTTTSFAVACSQTGAQLNFWSELDFDRGVLTDVSETSTTCLAPGMAFDLDSSGATLSVPNPDPYTGMEPHCVVSLGTDANGFTVYFDMTITSLDFTLLPAVKDKAPSGLLSVTANAVIAQDDGTGMGNYVIADTCTYSGTNDTYHRMSQP